MVALLQTIAMLCQLNTGVAWSSLETLDKAQLKCQQYYVECNKSKELYQCVLDRKL